MCLKNPKPKNLNTNQITKSNPTVAGREREREKEMLARGGVAVRRGRLRHGLVWWLFLVGNVNVKVEAEVIAVVG